MITKTRRMALVTGIVLLAATGCDDTRLKAFSDFAAAGSAYVHGFHSLTRSVADAQIAKSNAILLDVRDRMYNPPPGTPEQEKVNQKDLARIAQQDTKQVEEYLENLHLLDAHAAALGSYFKELASYTGDKNSKAISDSTSALAKSINDLAPDIAKMKFGNFAVGAARVAGNLAIAHIQVKQLDAIVSRDLNTLETAFALQQQATDALAQDLAESVHAATALTETNSVLLPYVNRGPLPRGWQIERERVIRERTMIGSGEAAKAAIQQLRASFEALVENKPAPVDLSSILGAVEKMAGYAKAVEDGAGKD